MIISDSTNNCDYSLRATPTFLGDLFSNDGLKALLAYNISNLLTSLKDTESIAKLLKDKMSLTNANDDIAIKNIFTDFLKLEGDMFKSLLTPYDFTAYERISREASKIRSKYCASSLNRTSGVAVGFLNKFFQLGSQMGNLANSIYDMGDYVASGLGLTGGDPYIIRRAEYAALEVKNAIASTISIIAPYISIDFSDPDKNAIYEETSELLLSNFLKGNLGTSLNAAIFCSVLDPLISLGMRLYGISKSVIGFYESIIKQIGRIWKMLNGIYVQLSKMENMTVAQVSSIALGFFNAVPGIRSGLLSLLRSIVGSISSEALQKIAAYLQTMDLNRRNKVLEGKLYVLIDKTYDSIEKSGSETNEQVIKKAADGDVGAAISRVSSIMESLQKSLSDPDSKNMKKFKSNSELRVKIAELAMIRDYFVSKQKSQNRSISSDGNIGYGYMFKGYMCSEKNNSVIRTAMSALEDIERVE